MEIQRPEEIRRWLLCGLIGLVTFFGLAFFYLRAGYLYDADSYVHLAVSRLYAEEGFTRGLPWPRFSVMHEGYGDKEILFHIALIPFVVMTDPATGGRLALAMFGSLAVASLALLFTRYLGPVGLVIPWWLLLASPPFLNRIIRLRPEILGLTLLLAAATCFIQRRWIALGIVALLYPLSYTAFHVLGALVGGWVLVEWIREKTFAWQPLVATATGVVAGNLIHPHPIDHLNIWWLQNVSYFGMKRIVEVEPEALPPPWQELVFVNAGWWLVVTAAVALIFSRLRRFPIDRSTIVYGSTAVLFFLLYLRMGRMVLYAVPFLTLTVAAAMREVRLSRRSKVLLTTLLLLGVPIGVMFNLRLPYFDRTLKGMETSSELELERFGHAVPPGARIAAEWSDTQLFAFWAPQGRYLNMYDPLFMVVKDPNAYEALRAMFHGRILDIPPIVKNTLDSDFLAIQTPWDNEALNSVLEGDPRWRVRHQGANVLLELQRPDNGEFLTEWEVTGRELRGRVRMGDPWRALVSPPANGCYRFERTVDCDRCSLDVRLLGSASVELDGERVRTIESKSRLSPWTTIEDVAASRIRIEYCGPSDGGFFVFRRTLEES